MKNKFYAFWLSLVCVAFFILQNLIPSFTDLLVLNKSALSGQIWRFLTAIFLHGSLSHITLNLFALLLFGLILESLIGSKRFLLVFFLSGIIGNIFAVFFYGSSLGASGAVMGILGTLTLIRPLMMVWTFGMPMPLFVASALWVTGDLMGFFYAEDNIGHIAHLAGLGIGLLAGIFFRKQRNKIRKRKIHIPERSIMHWEERYLNK